MNENLISALLAQNKELAQEVRRLTLLNESHYEDMRKFADSFAQLSTSMMGIQSTPDPQVETPTQDIDPGSLGGMLD